MAVFGLLSLPYEPVVWSVVAILLVSCGCLWSVSLPHEPIVWSVVCVLIVLIY